MCEHNYFIEFALLNFASVVNLFSGGRQKHVPLDKVRDIKAPKSMHQVYNDKASQAVSSANKV